MHRVAFLIPLAVFAQASAPTEDDEAMNKLLDTLMSSDSNTTDNMVDMIAEKLVDKLLGVVMMPQVAVVEPAALVRPAPSFRASVPQAPALTPVGYDNSKNVKIGEQRENVIKSRNKEYNSVKDSPYQRWGTGETIKGGQNPYGIKAPEVGERPVGKAINPVDMTSRYKPGPEYQNFGSADYEKLKGLGGFGAAREIDKGPDYVPKLMEMDEADGPDGVSIIATFLLSAFVGAGVTLALVRIRQGIKTGMRTPLLM
jgi:hypothetical protein